MTVSILALALAYVFLLFALLLAILRSEVRVSVKFGLVVFGLGFYLWHYASMKAALGWPAVDALPESFTVISAVTVEPDLKNGDPGSIFLWLRDLNSDRVMPRAHRLPYQKQLHQEVEKTLEKQQRGELFVGRPAAGGGPAQSLIEFEPVQRDRRLHKSGGDSQ